MRWRKQLQPVITLTASATQEIRFARRLGHAVSGVALVSVYRNTGGTVTFTMLSASHTAVRADAMNSFWLSVGQGAVATTGLARIAIADFGEWVRWDAVLASGQADFSILLELDDRKAD